MKKRAISILLITLMVFGCFTSITFGENKSKSMTTYNVIKKGNTVYCGTNRGLYKVNLKNGSVKGMYVRDKYEARVNGGAYALRIHKGYIYFLGDGAMLSYLYRVKTSGGKTKMLTGLMDGYAIKKGKIYYVGYNVKSEKTVKQVMNLNGKNKKKSKYKVKMKNKATNAKGYYISSSYEKTVWVDEGDAGSWWDHYNADYLVTPSGKRIKLCEYIDPYQ